MTDQELIAYLKLQGLDKDIAAADRIEELVKEVEAAQHEADEADAYAWKLENKLAKAVKTLQILKPLLGDSWVDRRVLAVLAELEKE